MSERHSHAVDDVEAAASPCISVCTLFEPARICLGCFRTLDEISEWSVMDNEAKLRVLAALPARRAMFGAVQVTQTLKTDAKR